jgi:hypothetical protein
MEFYQVLPGNTECCSATNNVIVIACHLAAVPVNHYAINSIDFTKQLENIYIKCIYITNDKINKKMLQSKKTACGYGARQAEYDSYGLKHTRQQGLLMFRLSPPPSSFGVDLTRLDEPRFFLRRAFGSVFQLTASREVE